MSTSDTSLSLSSIIAFPQAARSINRGLFGGLDPFFMELSMAYRSYANRMTFRRTKVNSVTTVSRIRQSQGLC